jgi:hypothetical protein
LHMLVNTFGLVCHTALAIVNDILMIETWATVLGDVSKLAPTPRVRLCWIGHKQCRVKP